MMTGKLTYAACPLVIAYVVGGYDFFPFALSLFSLCPWTCLVNPWLAISPGHSSCISSISVFLFNMFTTEFLPPHLGGLLSLRRSNMGGLPRGKLYALFNNPFNVGLFLQVISS